MATKPPIPTATPSTPVPTYPPQSIPFSEGFEITFSDGAPPGWTREYISESTDWTREAGGYNGHPSSSHGGSFNARFFYDDWPPPDRTTRLISPPLDFNGQLSNPRLTFWLAMEEWCYEDICDQDILSVYYRTAEGGSWNLLATYTTSLSTWTQKTLSLPEIGDGYRICFEGTANYGYGVCVDDLFRHRIPRTPTPTPDFLMTPTPSPTPAGRPWQTDFNGDGTSDIAVFRPETGLWAVRGLTRVYFGTGADIPIPGDYDGDGSSDYAVFRPSSSLWAVGGITRFYFGGWEDLPCPGDYNGNGRIDPAIFDPFSGLWAIRGISRFYYGGSNDLPVPGYYQNGICSAAVFRPSTGLWAVRGVTRLYYGTYDDAPEPGDYTGAGGSIPAIFHPSSGLWAIRRTSRFYFGRTGDEAVPADYRGRNSDQPAVYRPSTGLWAIRGLTRLYFGSSGDVPVTR